MATAAAQRWQDTAITVELLGSRGAVKHAFPSTCGAIAADNPDDPDVAKAVESVGRGIITEAVIGGGAGGSVRFRKRDETTI